MSDEEARLLLASIDARLGRIERALGTHCSRAEVVELERRVRANERGLLRVYTLGSLVSAGLGWLGLRS